MSALLVIPALRDNASLELTDSDWFPQATQDAMMMGLIGLGTLFHFLRRVTKMDKLLPPTLATVTMVGMMLFTGVTLELELLTTVALLSFVGSGAYLAVQGEWRSGMRSVARREERMKAIEAKQQTRIAHEETSDKTGVQLIDPTMIELAEKQKKRSKRAGSTGEMDLELVTFNTTKHRPLVPCSHHLDLGLLCLFQRFRPYRIVADGRHVLPLHQFGSNACRFAQTATDRRIGC